MKLSDLHKRKTLVEAGPPMIDMPEEEAPPTDDPLATEPGMPGLEEAPEEVENFTGDLPAESPEEVAGTENLGAETPKGTVNQALNVEVLKSMTNAINQLDGIAGTLGDSAAAQGADTPLGAKMAEIQSIVQDTMNVINNSILSGGEEAEEPLGLEPELGAEPEAAAPDDTIQMPLPGEQPQ